MKLNWQKLALLIVGLGICTLAAGCGAGVFQSIAPTPVPAPTPSPDPTVISLAPTFAIGGATSQTLTVTGSGFQNSSTVTYNGSPHPATLISSQQLTITLSSSDLATPGSFPVEVSNPTPGGGSGTATFNVWTKSSDPITGIQFAYPDFGGTAYEAPDPVSQPGTVSSPDIDVIINAAQPFDAAVLYITIYPNTNASTLQQWFESNVDVNGILLANSTYQTVQYSNGLTAMILSDSLPSQFLAAGHPVEEVYATSPDGRFVIAIEQGQETQLSSYGYSPNSLYPLMLAAITFK
jgi:hypothetical protein